MRSKQPGDPAPDGRTDHGEAGSVTAEFAVMLPTVLVVLALIIGSLMLAAHRIGLVGLAADIARLEARGDTSAAAARIDTAGDGMTIERQRADGLLCIELHDAPGRGLLGAISISARSCAALSGDAP